ncbi:MAG TPA: EAL domain-containing protein [Hydrogenophaga sp.]|nr:EAL domain-containing protein [Hydrogenophaga sp.]
MYTWPESGLVKERPVGSPAPALPVSDTETPLFRCQWSLVSGKLVAVELLWPAPRPDGSDCTAERLRTVLETACRQVAAWQQERQDDWRLDLPLHWLERALPGTVDDWLGALDAWGLKGVFLSVWVPERRAALDGLTLAATLSALRAAGAEVALAGFGSGTSGLSVLRELPLDVVRIDRAVVAGFAADPQQTALARSVIQLVHGLHLRVMAEGVADDELLKQLIDHGCDLAQGECFGMPQNAEALEVLLRAGATLPQSLLNARARARTLLLVDDEESILSALKRVFRRDGYQVVTATSGARGLELLAQQPIDVIVSDQRMPGMTGIEFLREAKRLYPRTVRMTLSGYTDLQSIIEAVNEGAVYKFLTKPWDDELLRSHVAHAFEQSELATENTRLWGAIHQANHELAMANQRLERMVVEEGERRLAMQQAAGASRDALDGLPMAVFGIGVDGMLAYVNRQAVNQWPQWASALGGDLEPSMQEVLDLLVPPAQRPHTDGLTTTIEGRSARAWICPLTGLQQPLGYLMLVQLLHESATLAPGSLT